MLSKRAAAFGVEALLGNKRTIDSTSPEKSQKEYRFSNKHLKTEHIVQDEAKESPKLIDSADNYKITIEKLAKNERDLKNNCKYFINRRNVRKSLHKEVVERDSVSKHENELLKSKNISPRFPNYHSYRFVEREKSISAGTSTEAVIKSPRNEFCSCSGRVLSSSGISVQLVNHELWSEFHQHQTEMIITKNGRRMFPVVKIRLFGLDPETLYILYLDIEIQDSKRYRYAYPNSRWTVSGTGEPLYENQAFIHPDSPSSGRQWMDAPMISFDKLKLTNNKTTDAKGQLFFHSMQKYVPRIWIQKVRNAKLVSKTESEDVQSQLESFVSRDEAVKFVFPETSFITVTAYQNQQITKLKINSNPFAKGFRENTKHKESSVCQSPSMTSDVSSEMLLHKKNSSQFRNLYQSFPSINVTSNSRFQPINFDLPPIASFDAAAYSLQACSSLFTASLLQPTASYPSIFYPSSAFQNKSEQFYESYPQSHIKNIPSIRFPNNIPVRSPPNLMHSQESSLPMDRIHKAPNTPVVSQIQGHCLS